VWDVETGAMRIKVTGQKDAISAAIPPDARMMANGNQDGTIVLWNPDNGSKIRTLKGKSDGMFSLAFAADNRTLASGGTGRAIGLWDAATGQELRMLEGASDSPISIAFARWATSVKKFSPRCARDTPKSSCRRRTQPTSTTCPRMSAPWSASSWWSTWTKRCCLQFLVYP